MTVDAASIAVIVAAGLGGCLGVSVIQAANTGQKVSVLAGNWRKCLVAILICLPLLALQNGGPMPAIEYLVAFAWLIAAPTVLSRLLGGTKDGTKDGTRDGAGADNGSQQFLQHTIFAFFALGLALAGFALLGR